VLARSNILHLRRKSLARGILLALAAFAASLRLAGFPDIGALHGSPWQIPLVCVDCWAMIETARCLRRRWSLYHAGVLILLYTELMILALAIVLCLYP
jgi:hypothetical protein